MSNANALLFSVILVSSVLISVLWSTLAARRAQTGQNVDGILTLNWIITAAFAVMGVTGAVFFFGDIGSFAIGWTMMICGGVVAVILFGHHFTLRKLGRDAEERQMLARDL